MPRTDRKRVALVELRDRIGEHLALIEDELKVMGWPGRPYITCIVRDPENDDMFSVTTSDPDLEQACRVALQPPAHTIMPGERP